MSHRYAAGVKSPTCTTDYNTACKGVARTQTARARVSAGTAELHSTASAGHLQDAGAVVAERVQFGQDVRRRGGDRPKGRRPRRRGRPGKVSERAQVRRQTAVPGRHCRVHGHDKAVPAEGVHAVRPEHVHSQLAGQHRPAEHRDGRPTITAPRETHGVDQRVGATTPNQRVPSTCTAHRVSDGHPRDAFEPSAMPEFEFFLSRILQTEYISTFFFLKKNNFLSVLFF